MLFGRSRGAGSLDVMGLAILGVHFRGYGWGGRVCGARSPGGRPGCLSSFGAICRASGGVRGVFRCLRLYKLWHARHGWL